MTVLPASIHEGRSTDHGHEPTPTDRMVAQPAIQGSFAWALAGNLAVGLVQFGMLSLLAKLCSTAVVGQFALSLAIINPILALCGLQVRSILASDAAHEHPWATYLGLRVLTNVVALLGILLVTVWSCDLDAVPVVLALTIWKLGSATSEVLYGRLQQHERMDCVSKSQILGGTLQCLVLAAGVYLTRDLVFGGCLLAITSWFMLVFYDWPATRRLPGLRSGQPTDMHWRTRGQLRRIGRLAWTTLPLGLMVMVGSLTASLPRYFVGHFLDLAAVGVLAALICPTTVGQQVMLALSQVTLPRFAYHLRQCQPVAFRRLLAQVIGWNAVSALTTFAICAVGGRFILSQLYTAEYARHYDCFLWLGATSAVNCLGALGGVLTAARWYRCQLAIAVLTFAATVVSCAVLIPLQGIRGATVALLIVAVVRLLAVAVAVSALLFRLPGQTPRRGRGAGAVGPSATIRWLDGRLLGSTPRHSFASAQLTKQLIDRCQLAGRGATNRGTGKLEQLIHHVRVQEFSSHPVRTVSSRLKTFDGDSAKSEGVTDEALINQDTAVAVVQINGLVSRPKQIGRVTPSLFGATLHRRKTLDVDLEACAA